MRRGLIVRGSGFFTARENNNEIDGNIWPIPRSDVQI